MPHPVNFLPWRRQHYGARLRLRCVVWRASLLPIASLATHTRSVLWQGEGSNALRAQSQ
ncbi:pilus assembly protein PilN, partial [Salmonella enterica subsp. enterica serovar Typhimurium]